jgi:hypothetical protein
VAPQVIEEWIRPPYPDRINSIGGVMKHGIVAAALSLLVLLPACSGDEATLVSSARAASPTEQALYPSLAADAADGHVHEYY